MHVIWQAEEAACCQSESEGPPRLWIRAGAGAGARAGASSLIPCDVGLIHENDACPEGPVPAGASRGVSGFADTGTVSKPGGSRGKQYWGAETINWQHPPERPTPRAVPGLSASRTRTRRAGWHRCWSLPPADQAFLAICRERLRGGLHCSPLQK